MSGRLEPSGDAPASVVCRGLTKRFTAGGGVLAVDALDLDVPAASVFGLLGPNGAGKTTTLRLITGLARPTAGSVEIDGVAVRPESASRGAIGVLDQDPRYYGWMSGRELVELAGRLQGLEAGIARDRARETLALVGLTDAARRRVGGYSGGMRQRLGIAQALVSRPRLLILDEPVSSLDPEGRRDLLALIADLRATATVIFSTHVLGDVERICDRVGIIAAGRLVTEGPLEELLARYALPLYRIESDPGQEATAAALATSLRTVPWIDGVTEDGGRLVVSVTNEGAASEGLLRLVVDSELHVASFERVRPSLEDVFLRLVGRDGAAA
ncbi:MAG: ATP-binding cassette domain-containing protein [Chloroflexota bacterium]